MKLFYTLRLRLRSLFRHNRVEQELDEELRYHLERQMEHYIAEGLTPDEARYAALRAIGGVDQQKEECRDMRHVNFIDDLARDIRYGLRGLRTNRGFAVVAVLTMALGIGANTAIFSVVHAALLRPLPYLNPDRLVVVESVSPTAGVIRSVSPGDYRDYRQQAVTLDHLAGYSGDGFGFQLNERPETVRAACITENFFDALGVRPMLGRSFSPDEMLTRGPRAVVLSHRLWQGRFGGDRTIIGSQIKSGQSSVTVVGVEYALVRSFRNALLILMGAVSMVLLIACANVASLMLARSTSRRREVAVRLALGAGRLRLVRQLIVEGILVSSLGATAGLALAKWSIGAFFALLPDTSLTA